VVNFEAKDGNDRTPLHLAPYGDHPPVVQYLCELGTDREARSGNYTIPLHWEASKGTSLWCSTCVSGGSQGRKKFVCMT